MPTFDVLLPVGISFYTFQTLSYSIDVYRGRKTPETHLGIFALYVAFFPQLVAGPIERSHRLLHQFYQQHNFDHRRVSDGLKLMAWGLFKKVVIADRLAIVVNNVYNDPTAYAGIPLLVATYFFAFQIYCDFSGYSDIAIGAAQIMGIDLMQNFKQPYFSRSIPEFWRRWHISLSSWFKDYLYIPLGGNRLSQPRVYLNLMLVFVISGLWHGANWTFLIWGALHGSYILVTLWTTDLRRKAEALLGLTRRPVLLAGLQVFITFHLVTFAWIFFRANSLSDALYIMTHLFHGIRLTGTGTGVGPYDLFIALLAILLLELVHVLQRQKGSLRQLIAIQPVWLRWTAYYGLTISILIFGKFGVNEFIYFQF